MPYTNKKWSTWPFSHHWLSKRRHTTPVEKKLQQILCISKNHHTEVRTTKIWGNLPGKLFKQFQSVCVCSSLIFSLHFFPEKIWNARLWRSNSSQILKKTMQHLFSPFSFTQTSKLPAAFNSFKRETEIFLDLLCQ